MLLVLYCIISSSLFLLLVYMILWLTNWPSWRHNNCVVYVFIFIFFRSSHLRLLSMLKKWMRSGERERMKEKISWERENVHTFTFHLFLIEYLLECIYSRGDQSRLCIHIMSKCFVRLCVRRLSHKKKSQYSQLVACHHYSRMVIRDWVL